jgi:hypothetical protein
MNVMFDEGSPRRRLGPKGAWVFAVYLATSIGRRALPRAAPGLAALPALQEGLQLMLQVSNPPPQLGILGFEFGNPLVARVVHDQPSLRETTEMGKRNCLTVTVFQQAPR